MSRLDPLSSSHAAARQKEHHSLVDRFGVVPDVDVIVVANCQDQSWDSMEITGLVVNGDREPGMGTGYSLMRPL